MITCTPTLAPRRLPARRLLKRLVLVQIQILSAPFHFDEITFGNMQAIHLIASPILTAV